VAISYRARDGRTDYKFDIVEHRPGQWRVYIVDQPGYRGRATDAHSTHRLSDSRGQYVCWTQPITSRDHAYTIAASWAEGTQSYISTGRFDEQVVSDWRVHR
jgi:hypothetical protein